MATLNALLQHQIHLDPEQVNGFLTLRQGRRHGQVKESPPTKRGSRNQLQAHLLAQSVHQRSQKPLERGRGPNGDRTSPKRYPLMAYHCLLVWQYNRSRRLRLTV
jgi:hypothetical protein